MRLYGTVLGEEIFRDTPYDIEFMKANESNTRNFKMSNWLNSQQLKGYMSKARVELMNDRANRKIKEDNWIAEATDPLLKKINSLAKPKLNSMLKRIHLNHQSNYIEDVNKKPKELKIELHTLVTKTYNSDPNDIELFNL